MDLNATILGTAAVTKLNETRGATVLQVGSDILTRRDLAKVECYNFHAARLLTHVLHHDLKVPNLRHVFDNIAPVDLAVPTLGVISLAVLGAAFQAKNIGGVSPLENYVKKHLAKNAKLTTFDTIKHRQAQEAAQERKAKKARKAQRQNTAQAIRVERFTERQETANG